MAKPPAPDTRDAVDTGDIGLAAYVVRREEVLDRALRAEGLDGVVSGISLIDSCTGEDAGQVVVGRDAALGHIVLADDTPLPRVKSCSLLVDRPGEDGAWFTVTVPPDVFW